MNLITEPWIPAIKLNGDRNLFSLREIFSTAQDIKDLTVKPHERIALMRLLICITQAALDGPEDEDDWEECLDDIQPKVAQYLEKWKNAFELLGDGQRFLQLPGLAFAKSNDTGTNVSKLELALASGNNPTIFDNEGAVHRSFNLSRIALNLLTFQCFSPGGRIGVCQWNGKDTPGKGSSAHAPCVPRSMLHAFVSGENFLSVIHHNLVTKTDVEDAYSGRWGKPVWEFPVNSSTDKKEIENATQTFLGRLTPVSRAIRILENNDQILLGNGLEYPEFPSFREFTSTIILKKEELGLLSASTGRSIWRQLPAMLVKQKDASSSAQGPLTLRHNFNSEFLEIWIGALLTDKAKIENFVESRYTVHRSLQSEFGRLAYEAGVAFADTVCSSSLLFAVGQYYERLSAEKAPKETARKHYWTRVEQGVHLLFDAASNLVAPDKFPESEWGKWIFKCALDAYEQTCPKLTPRQLEAYSWGLRFLTLKKNNKNSKTESKK